MAKASNTKSNPTPVEPVQELAHAIIGPLQLRVMRILWSSVTGGGTVADVHAAINGTSGHPPLAYTTILTVMRNLARRLVVTQIPGGRQHVFKPKLTAAQYERRVMTSLLHELFLGDKARLTAAATSV